MRIAAFISHPIQYYTPLWQELSRRPGICLKVFYFSRRSLDVSFDPGFGRTVAWDMDLLASHDYSFLPRQWPTRDPLDYSGTGLNSRLIATLREGWDVVFVSGHAHMNNWIIIAACKALRIPVLCIGDTNSSSDRDKPPWKRVAKRAILAPFMRNVTAFLAPGGQQRTCFLSYGARVESVFICPFVVDVDRFRKAVAEAGSSGLKALRERYDIADGKKVVAFIGKLLPVKRPLDLVRALAMLGRADLIGLFVGDGQMRGEVIQVGGDQVRVTGFVNRSEIPLVLSLADIVVLPSEFEPYGIVVSEAQVLGIPCVASDRCGCHGPDSVLQDGRSGLVYRCGDLRALTSSIRTLLDDSALYARMSACARAQGETQSQYHAANGFLAAAEYAVHSMRQ